jgi:tRNA-binding protein
VGSEQKEDTMDMSPWEIHSKEELKDKLILAVINFPPKQIGPVVSEVLILGVPDKKGNCVLVVPDRETAKIGGRLY